LRFRTPTTAQSSFSDDIPITKHTHTFNKNFTMRFGTLLGTILFDLLGVLVLGDIRISKKPLFVITETYHIRRSPDGFPRSAGGIMAMVF
jgi:hypothetical protein